MSFVNAQGSVKIRLVCSKALLLTMSSSNIVTHSNGYIKGDKYLFTYLLIFIYLLFIKVGAANVLLKVNYLQSRVETHNTERSYHHSKQYQTFYIERSSVTY